MACLSFTDIFAQKETYDLFAFTPPAGWKKELKENSISFIATNKKNGSWCRIGILKSTISKGSIENDFESEWQELIVKNYNPTEAPVVNEVYETDGWKVKVGVAKFKFNNADAQAMLTTISGFNRCASIVITINNQDYLKNIDTFLQSVEFKKMETAAQSPVAGNGSDNISIIPEEIKTTPAKQSAAIGFAFTNTNFDDGWIAAEKEDWVEVKKGNIKVLLHYPKEGTVFPADPEPLTNGAWNILVAPRYKNLKNYKTTYISTYNRPYLGMGYATEIATEKNVFIVFFLQDRAWIEFITPDKNTFIQQYKFDPEIIQWDSESDLMIPLANMTRYNKFAVAASDFKGKWTSDFTGIQQMYYVYTGQYAGMNMNQSNEEFIFNEGNTYSWKLLVVKGMVGDVKYTEVKSSGKFEVPINWQVKFSMIESRARTYNAYWSCIKGARILNLLDADYPGSGVYEKFGLAK
jgi:hypothetical protein